MKISTIIVISIITITLSGCSEAHDNKPIFYIVEENVTMWEDPVGEHYMILAFEVSNLTNTPLHFMESDFDIVDENGNLVDTMKSVSAYPPIVKPDQTAVYYGVKMFDEIADKNANLSAVSHIEAEKSEASGDKLHFAGVTTGGSTYSTGIIKNASRQVEYNNVHIAIVSRKDNNEVVSVMTTIIETINPLEQIEFKAEDCLKQRFIGPDIVTHYQHFAYTTP